MVIGTIIFLVRTLLNYRTVARSLALAAVLCFITASGTATTYYNISNSGSLHNTNQWGINTDGSGTHPSNFTTSGDVFNIYNGSSTAIAGNWALGTVTVNIGNGSAMAFSDGSHNMSGGTVNIGAGSTLTVTGTFTAGLGTLNITSTFVYNSSSAYAIPAVTFGNFTYSGSGASNFTAGSTTTVAGNFTQSNGSLKLATSSATTNLTINGNASFTGGSFDFCSGSGSGTNFNINVAQNLTIGSGFSLTTSGTVNNGAFVFNGSGTSSSPQLLTVNTTSTLQYTNFIINSGTYVQLAGSASTINITGSTTISPSDYRGTVTVSGTLDGKNMTFTPSAANSVVTVNSGATIITQNTGGVGGTASTGLFTGTNWTNSFSGGANYTFNGTAAQSTSPYMPASMTSGGDVTINNAAGVTLSQATTIGATDTLNLTRGTFTNGTSLTMNSGSTVVVDSGKLGTTPTTYSGVNLVYANLGSNASAVITGNEFPASFTGNVTVDKTGATITLNNAKALTGPLTISAGTLDASASNYNFSLTGAWTNNSGASAFTARSATVTCNGSSAQTIGGSYSTTFNSLAINNSAGVSLGADQNVNGTLTLTSGRLTLGSSNLVMGSSSPAVAGTLSSSDMVVATGAGKMKKTFTANGSYLFPVGDGTGPNYSPITLSVSGSAYSGATAGANVTKAKHPNNANTTNYLNRYWSVALVGITSPSCTVTAATYVTGDVTGTEASISAGKYAAALPWVKFGATNTGTHTLSTTAITNTTFDISGITTATPSVSSSASTAICSGNSTTLIASSGTGDPTLTYSWAPSTGLSATTGTSVTASPTSTTTYTLTIMDGNGFTGTASTTVTVNTAPAAITGTTAFCMPSTTALNDVTSGGTWSSSATGTATVGTGGVVTGVAAGNATISYTIGACSATAPVTVSTAPTAGPTNNGPICNASTVTLTANGAGSTNTYTWSGPSLSSTTAATPTATPSVTSTYSLTASYGASGAYPGCTSTTYTTTVTVRPTGQWLGGTSTAWLTGSNWCGGVPSATTDVLIPSGTTYSPSVTTGTATSRNLTVSSSASLTLSGGTLQIAGTISNSGTFTASAGGTIEMTGSSAQTIPASTFASNTINNLTVSNTSGVTLGGTLKVSGVVKANTGNLASAGFLTLLSTSSQTALIDGSGGASVTGTVTMQRYLDSSYGYRYISSPFTAATNSQLSTWVNLHASFPQLYYNSENVNYAGWVIDTLGTDTLKPMIGYSANFGTSVAAETISLSGTVNNGSQSLTLYNHNQTYTLGYNLVGNPYPSPIDWNASSGWTKTNIDNAIYFFNAGDTNQYYGTYDSYVGGVSSDGLASNIIPAMQGYFVHVSNGTYPVTGTLASTNSVRVNNLTPYYHKGTSSATNPLVRIDAGYSTGGSRSDPAVVYFNDSALNKFDNAFDALKLMNTDPNVPNLYSVSPDEKQLSIQALPNVADTMQFIPLGLQLSKDGWITFNTRNLDNIPTGIHVWFYDTKAGKSQDLLTDPQYRVYLGAGKYENRFFLMYTPGDHVHIPGVNGELNAYTSGKDLFVYETYGEGKLVVTNMAGQVVARATLDGNGYHMVTLDVTTGVYIATLYSGMGKQSKKIFIGN